MAGCRLCECPTSATNLTRKWKLAVENGAASSSSVAASESPNLLGENSRNASNLYGRAFCLLELKHDGHHAIYKYRAFPPVSPLIALNHLLSGTYIP